jgi:hypothetical protein
MNRRNAEESRLHSSGAEQIALIAGREARFYSRGKSKGSARREGVLGANHDVAEACGGTGQTKQPLIRIRAFECVHREIVPRREPLEAREHAGVEPNPHEGYGDADVEPIRHAIVRKDDRGISRQPQRELRLDEIAFERRRQMRAVGRRGQSRSRAAAVSVPNVEVDTFLTPLLEIQPFEGVVGGVLVAESDAHLAAARGQGAFRERRTETLAAARQRAERGIERVGKSTGWRANRIGGQQCQQRLIDLRRHLELALSRPEVRDVIWLVGKVRRQQRDRVAEQLRQDRRKRCRLRGRGHGKTTDRNTEHTSRDTAAD